jgi:carbonic anhydrase
MHRRKFIKSIAALAACPLCASPSFAAEFGYEGERGPEKWGDLDAASKVCSAGAQQSPIDITGAIKSQLPPLQIAWKKGADTIVNNGHTVQVSVAEGSTLTVAGEKYTLLQFHFHRPSEHLIGGKNFPMEVHFVHRNAAGGLAVVGAMMTAGKANAEFRKVVSAMPAKEGPAVKADGSIDPGGMLPAKHSYYRYSGSLTTPPCSETVNWLLLTEPLQVAGADIEAFGKLFAGNARPVQKPNRRFILQSS